MSEKGLGCEGYRLPTEAEWEYMARAGTQEAFAYPAPGGTPKNEDCECGPEPGLEPYGWYCYNSNSVSHVIGGKQPNVWGLYDTAGNLREWCWDRYAVDYYSVSPEIDPMGSDAGGRVVRGGFFAWHALWGRSAARDQFLPTDRGTWVGFRVVRTLAPCGDGWCAPCENFCNCPEDCVESTCEGCCTAGQCKSGEEPGWCGQAGAPCEDCTLDDMSCVNKQCVCECGDGMCCAEEDCVLCPSDCGDCCDSEACDPMLEECVEVTTGGFACVAKMVAIPAGNFWMGCNNCAGSTVNDTSCGLDENPYHEVYLDAYEIDKTEVTAAQYLACATAGGCSAAGTGSYATYQVGGKEKHPINYVNWSQAAAYCVWAGKELCTEAEWEKGARGGCEKNGGPSNCKAQSRKYPWGNEPATCDLAVMYGCYGDTQPVCSVSPAGDSPYGLCDMAGNVWGWVADWYQKDYYCDGDGATGYEYCPECGSWPGSPNAWNNPFGAISGSFRVKRGGGFGYGGVYLRVSFRGYDFPSADYFNLGSRCCRSE